MSSSEQPRLVDLGLRRRQIGKQAIDGARHPVALRVANVDPERPPALAQLRADQRQLLLPARIVDVTQVSFGEQGGVNSRER